MEWQLEHWLSTSHARKRRARAVRQQLAEARALPPLWLARPPQPPPPTEQDSYEALDELESGSPDTPERWPQLVESNAVPYLTPEERKGPRGAGPSSPVAAGVAEEFRAPPPLVWEYLGVSKRQQPPAPAVAAAGLPPPPWGCKATCLLPWLLVSQGRLGMGLYRCRLCGVVARLYRCCSIRT